MAETGLGSKILTKKGGKKLLPPLQRNEKKPFTSGEVLLPR
jgi:hypothetical protein